MKNAAMMRKLVRRRPSAAMVVAITGLVAATSGNAVADGVTAVASVVGKDQVTSRSVKDNSLLMRDFKRSERARLRGSPGAKGEHGVDALGAVSRKNKVFSLPTAPTVNLCTGPAYCPAPRTHYVTGTVTCDPGQVAVGGGAAPDNRETTALSESYPTADGTGWTASVGNSDITSPHSFTLHVLCVPSANPAT